MNPTSSILADIQSAGQPGNSCFCGQFRRFARRSASFVGSIPSGCSWPSLLWLGFCTALLVMGREPLNPRNIDWLGEDGSHHYIGWELLRQDPHWHWPLMYTNRFGYPVGESVALVDVNPWMALPFKMFSPLLPEPFQYFGIEAVLCLCPPVLFRTKVVPSSSGREPLG